MFKKMSRLLTFKNKWTNKKINKLKNVKHHKESNKQKKFKIAT